MARRKIAGAFKTTPIAALEAELGLPPTDLRLDRIQRAFTARLFTLLENHPLLPMCHDNFPKTLDKEREPPPGTFTPWHDQETTKPRYETRLVRNLSLMNS